MDGYMPGWMSSALVKTLLQSDFTVAEGLLFDLTVECLRLLLHRQVGGRPGIKPPLDVRKIGVLALHGVDGK